MSAEAYNRDRVKSDGLPQSVLDWCEAFGSVAAYQGAMMLDADGCCGPKTQAKAEGHISEGWQPSVMLDMARYQRDVDCDALRDSGVKAAYLKASQGESYVDPTFHQRTVDLIAVGIPVGGYHYCVPGDPIAQAQHFKRVMGSFCRYDLKPVVDFEDEAFTSRDSQPFVEAFLAEMTRDGWSCVLYSYGPVLRHKLALHDFGVPVWYARYNRLAYEGETGGMIKAALGHRIAAWQCTNGGGKWAGVSGRVDVNLLGSEGLAPFLAE